MSRVRTPPARAIGQGLVAGVAGTAAMTASSTLEMRLREREPSTVPARAAAKVLRLEIEDPEQLERLGVVVHWAYGTGWGAVRGLLGAAGLRGPAAAGALLAAVWGSDLVMLPALGVGVPPVWRWGATEVAIDALHHVVYATATSVAYELLDGVLSGR